MLIWDGVMDRVIISTDVWECRVACSCERVAAKRRLKAPLGCWLTRACREDTFWCVQAYLSEKARFPTDALAQQKYSNGNLRLPYAGPTRSFLKGDTEHRNGDADERRKVWPFWSTADEEEIAV